MSKEKLGFKTSATNLEEKFDKVQKLLAGKKANWTRLSALAGEQLLQERQLLETKKQSFTDVAILWRGVRLLHWENLVTIAALGKEIAETHRRLAKCEKAIEELKLRP